MSNKAGGISMTMFIVGIVIAILASSALSTVIATQFAVGPQGPAGIDGDVGLQGPKGDKGDTGVQGVQGIQGVTGPQGTTGPQGPQGVQGTQGVTGPQGTTGPQGPQGETGTQGEQGEIGSQGPPGLPGVFEVTTANDLIFCNETTFIDMENTFVTITLSETSDIIVLFSCEAETDYDEQIAISCLVNDQIALPGMVILTPGVSDQIGSDNYRLSLGAYAFDFFQPSVEPGTYTIRMQWGVSVGETCYIWYRTLAVIALPTQQQGTLY